MEAIMSYEEDSRKLQYALMLNKDSFSLVTEYAELATKRPLPDRDADRLESILNLAEEDGVLEFWIGEVDHFLDHELRLITAGKTIYPIETQRLKEELLKHLNLDSQNSGLIKSLNEEGNITIDIIPSEIPKVQSNLKARGLYPGPIDGVAGSRTVEALKNFQKQHNLEPSGLIDGTTLIALEAV